MIYDKRLIEHMIEHKKGKGEMVPVFYKVVAYLFSSRLFSLVVTVFESVIKLILSLNIPIYKDIILAGITYLPGIPFFLGNYLRGLYWSKKLKKLGKNCIIEQGVVFREPKGVELDEFVLIDRNVFFEAKRVIIGKRVHIAEKCTIVGTGELIVEDYSALCAASIFITASDTPRYGYRASGPMAPYFQRKVVIGKIHIKRDAFIGPAAIIFPNITIGEGSVIVAGTVIKKDTKDWEIQVDRHTKIKVYREKINFPE